MLYRINGDIFKILLVRNIHAIFLNQQLGKNLPSFNFFQVLVLTHFSKTIYIKKDLKNATVCAMKHM